MTPSFLLVSFASLKSRGLHFLFQLTGLGRQGAILARWKSVMEVGLTGAEAVEWTRFIRDLDQVGITLTDQPDELIWTGGNNSGIISAKNAYVALATKLWSCSENWWHSSVWKWDLAPKIKLFSWLLLENQILTWDILQHRGFSGPSVCALCLLDSETSLHLMLHCRFSQ
jgi:hypothetical protein